MCVWKEQDPHSHVDPEPDWHCNHQEAHNEGSDLISNNNRGRPVRSRKKRFTDIG